MEERYIVKFIRFNGNAVYQCYEEGADGASWEYDPSLAIEYNSYAEACQTCICDFNSEDLAEFSQISIIRLS